jgi:hypothetical protein
MQALWLGCGLSSVLRVFREEPAPGLPGSGEVVGVGMGRDTGDAAGLSQAEAPDLRREGSKAGAGAVQGHWDNLCLRSPSSGQPHAF